MLSLTTEGASGILRQGLSTLLHKYVKNKNLNERHCEWNEAICAQPLITVDGLFRTYYCPQIASHPLAMTSKET